MWLDNTFGGLTRLRAPIPEDASVFLEISDHFMNVGLPREIFNNDKPERFALIALVYWLNLVLRCYGIAHKYNTITITLI